MRHWAMRSSRGVDNTSVEERGQHVAIYFKLETDTAVLETTVQIAKY